jgi:hypothetical protein
MPTLMPFLGVHLEKAMGTLLSAVERLRYQMSWPDFGDEGIYLAAKLPLQWMLEREIRGTGISCKESTILHPVEQVRLAMCYTQRVPRHRVPARGTPTMDERPCGGLLIFAGVWGFAAYGSKTPHTSKNACELS